jgi:sucrose phosphorylase
MELLASKNVGRDINRPYLDAAKIDEALNKPVVKGLIALIKIRNEHPAFAGEFTAQGGASVCCLMWKLEQQSISLSIDFTSRTALITQVNGAHENTLNLQSLLV